MAAVWNLAKMHSAGLVGKKLNSSMAVQFVSLFISLEYGLSKAESVASVIKYQVICK